MDKELINYQILKKLGCGKFGEVYLGKPFILEQFVAIKVLDKRQIQDEYDLERIKNEIQILQKVKHPHLVEMYDFQESINYLFIIMEYLEGGELFEKITHNKKLPEKLAFSYFMQILKGVSYLHQIEIVHRDLKPENILLTKCHKLLKIADFGLGKQYQTKELLKTACGSPCYAPPEMFGKSKYDPKKIDIWAMGVILYAMINGFLPFDDQESKQILKNIMKYKISFDRIPCDLLKDLLQQMIERIPQKRINFIEVESHPWILKFKQQDFSNEYHLCSENCYQKSQLNYQLLRKTENMFKSQNLYQIIKNKEHSLNLRNNRMYQYTKQKGFY